MEMSDKIFTLRTYSIFTTQQSMADSSTEAPFARVALLPLVVATVDCLASLPTSLKSVHEGHRIFVTLLERLRGQADWQQDPKLLELSASVALPLSAPVSLSLWQSLHFLQRHTTMTSTNPSPRSPSTDRPGSNRQTGGSIESTFCQSLCHLGISDGSSGDTKTWTFTSSSRRSAWYISKVASLRLRREYKPKWLSGPRCRNTGKGSASVKSSGVTLSRKSCSNSLKIDSSGCSWLSPKASWALIPSWVQRRAWIGTVTSMPGLRSGSVTARKSASSLQEGDSLHFIPLLSTARWAVSCSLTLVSKPNFSSLQASIIALSFFCSQKKYHSPGTTHIELRTAPKRSHRVMPLPHLASALLYALVAGLVFTSAANQNGKTLSCNDGTPQHNCHRSLACIDRKRELQHLCLRLRCIAGRLWCRKNCSTTWLNKADSTSRNRHMKLHHTDCMAQKWWWWRYWYLCLRFDLGPFHCKTGKERHCNLCRTIWACHGVHFHTTGSKGACTTLIASINCNILPWPFCHTWHNRQRTVSQWAQRTIALPIVFFMQWSHARRLHRLQAKVVPPESLPSVTVLLGN